jgi:hypothetical protein
MKSIEELCKEYTIASNDYWNAHREKHGIQTQIDALLIDKTKALKKNVRALVRNTQWHMDEAKYYSSINHANRPVTASIQGHIVLDRSLFACEEKSRSELTFSFNANSEAFILSEIKRIAQSA